MAPNPCPSLASLADRTARKDPAPSASLAQESAAETSKPAPAAKDPRVQVLVHMTTRERLAELSAAVWNGFACGTVSGEDAQAFAEEIAARKVVPPKPAEPRRCVGSRPRSPAAMDRRRRWTSSGWLPPQLAALFTMGEAAALSAIAAEVARRGLCRLGDWYGR